LVVSTSLAVISWCLQLKNPVAIVVFDMDGVLVDIESSWSCVHSAFKVSKNENLSRYLSGEIDFKELMRRDIRLWGRVNISDIERVLASVRIMKGAKEAIAKLREAGCYTAIISAGISVLADRLQKTLGIDCSMANELCVDEKGMLTGEGREVVPLLGKVNVFRRLLHERGTSAADCAVIGDSRYDIPLFEEAGLSIAFNTSDEKVKEKADIVVHGKNLLRVLPIILKKRTA
jgi:phosphoserine phosphatase